MSDRHREGRRKRVSVDSLRGWQIVLQHAINTNFSTIQWGENETAL